MTGFLPARPNLGGLLIGCRQPHTHTTSPIKVQVFFSRVLSYHCDILGELNCLNTTVKPENSRILQALLQSCLQTNTLLHLKLFYTQCFCHVSKVWQSAQIHRAKQLPATATVSLLEEKGGWLRMKR